MLPYLVLLQIPFDLIEHDADGQVDRGNLDVDEHAVSIEDESLGTRIPGEQVRVGRARLYVFGEAGCGHPDCADERSFQHADLLVAEQLISVSVHRRLRARDLRHPRQGQHKSNG
jgi:hypothetical protein